MAASPQRRRKEARYLRMAARLELDDLIAKQEGKCKWCECVIERGINATVDHVWPISDGGRNRANMVAACVDCNHRRNREHIEESRRIQRLLEAKKKTAKLKPFNRSKVDRKTARTFHQKLVAGGHLKTV